MVKVYGARRIFNGEPYSWVFTSSVKARAEEKADKLRRKGYLVRMIKQCIGYMVYRRKG